MHPLVTVEIFFNEEEITDPLHKLYCASSKEAIELAFKPIVDKTLSDHGVNWGDCIYSVEEGEARHALRSASKFPHLMCIEYAIYSYTEKGKLNEIRSQIEQLAIENLKEANTTRK